MQTRIARFKGLVSTKSRHADGNGIPAEVLELITYIRSLGEEEDETAQNESAPGAEEG